LAATSAVTTVFKLTAASITSENTSSVPVRSVPPDVEAGGLKAEFGRLPVGPGVPRVGGGTGHRGAAHSERRTRGRQAGHREDATLLIGRGWQCVRNNGRRGRADCNLHIGVGRHGGRLGLVS